MLTPLGPDVSFDTAKLLVELIGRIATARHSQFATMERRVDKRGGRMYVDTGQTGPSRTIVSPYSVRAYPGATGSTDMLAHPAESNSTASAAGGATLRIREQCLGIRVSPAGKRLRQSQLNSEG